MDKINNKKNFIIRLASIFIILSVWISCDDSYDEHYSMDNSERSELNILDYMKSRSELSKFVELLEFTGYADTLALSQSFTVFALTNEALADLNLNESNKENLKLQTGNHLASYSQTSSGYFKAFNGKYLYLLQYGDKYVYQGIEIKEPNILTKNGLIHIMDSPVPYVFNIWEFIQNSSSIETFKDYLNSLTELVLDEENSYDQDNVFIDSVMMEENRFLTKLGDINDELYSWTMIVPTNTAWNETYNKIFPFYRSLDKIENNKIVKTGEELQEERAKWAVTQDCLFAGLITNPGELDSLISKNGNVFKDPAYLFENTTRYNLSNGYAYVTDHINNKMEDSWLKTLEVEAESDFYSLRSNTNCNLIPYSSFGTNITASNNYYTRFENLPTSDFSKVSARFPIPNTLANVKYNIYCVFIPISAIDTTDQRPYKLNFYLSYIDNNGNKVTDVAVKVDNPATEPGKVTKKLIAENFEFPYCDQISQEAITNSNYSSDINVFLKVENAATVREERNGVYSRNVAIDCIILEPVIE